MENLQEIKDRLAAATPGPWRWSMNPKSHQLMLISCTSMGPIVMEFWRWGTQSAIAVFRDFKHDILEKATLWAKRRRDHHDFDYDIIHPDAHFIANAPSDMKILLEEIERLEKENKRLLELHELAQVIRNALECDISDLKANLEAQRNVIEEYMSGVDRYREESSKIPTYCSYADYEPPLGMCTPKPRCPKICPKYSVKC